MYWFLLEAGQFPQLPQFPVLPSCKCLCSKYLQVPNMTRHCSVPGCKSRHGKEGNEGISFHEFPKNGEMKQAWLDNLQRKKSDGSVWHPYKGAKVCSLHFARACFKQVSENNNKLTRRILLSSSIPTKRMAVPNYHLKHRSCKFISSVSTSSPEGSAPHLVPGQSMLSELSKVSSPTGPSPDEPSSAPTSASLTHQPVPSSSSSSVPPHLMDHTYASFPNEQTANDCKKLRQKVCQLVKEKKRVQASLTRTKQTLGHRLCDIQSLKAELKKVIPAGSFDSVVGNLQLVTDLTVKSKRKFKKSVREFAMTVFFYSPKVYRYLRKSFVLPTVKTLRHWTMKSHCFPGFQDCAFKEIQRRVALAPEDYKCAALMIDGMSIKEAVSIIPGFNRTIGLVDVGGLEEVKEEEAKEALIVMVVGLKAKWKLAIGYFLVRRTPGSLVQKIIKESLIRTHNVGMTIFTVTADGARGNISALKKLGAVVEPSNIVDWNPPFLIQDSVIWKLAQFWTILTCSSCSVKLWLITAS